MPKLHSLDSSQAKEDKCHMGGKSWSYPVQLLKLVKSLSFFHH